MTNPLAGLRAPLERLAEDTNVLPAGGGAQEYLQRFDLDEHYDRIAQGAGKTVEDIRERPGDKLYVPTPPATRAEDHCFRAFVDGSARITFLGTLVGSRRATPVVLAQIGAAAIGRDDDGRLGTLEPRIQLKLVLDRGSIAEATWDEVESAATASGIGLIDAAEKSEYTDNEEIGPVKEPRSRAAHKANWDMRELERDILGEVVATLPDEAWAVIDGGLGREFRQQSEPEGFVGVVKNFGKDLTFSLPQRGGGRRRVDLHILLARLEPAHRTALFGRPDGRTAFWYVRLRGPTELDYPLMGVVKVEVPLAAGAMVDGELVDRLSRCLVAERTVAPHGRDPRWHAHLYPISVAERAIRVRFVSHDVLRAAVRWPTPKDGE
jgi:hypothetical protein